MTEVAPPTPRVVGILLYEGVELLDFAGPAEVFIVAGEGRLFRVVTLAAGPERALRTMGGVRITADHGLADAPALDVLVLPGGDMDNVDARAIAWVTEAAARVQITMSVCMGALLAARAGLLDDVDATTHHWGLERLQTLAPRCHVVTGRRFVDAGRVVTTAGVTAGIDGALHVVARLCGEDAAQWAATEWMEHPQG
jgi:transcriptional regulator GlxA family with amidase domain